MPLILKRDPRIASKYIINRSAHPRWILSVQQTSIAVCRSEIGNAKVTPDPNTPQVSLKNLTFIISYQGLKWRTTGLPFLIPKWKSAKCYFGSYFDACEVCLYARYLVNGTNWYSVPIVSCAAFSSQRMEIIGLRAVTVRRRYMTRRWVRKLIE